MIPYISEPYYIAPIHIIAKDYISSSGKYHNKNDGYL